MPTRFPKLKEFWYYFSVNRGAVIGLYVFIFMILAALSAPILAPHAPDMQYRDAFLAPPAWHNGGSWKFILGTDAVGRDMFSRLMFGAQLLAAHGTGAVVVSLSLVGGIALGLVAGFFRGWVDIAITRVMDIILAFPSLLLALVIVTILGPSLFNAMLAIALVFWCRISRGWCAPPSWRRRVANMSRRRRSRARGISD